MAAKIKWLGGPGEPMENEWNGIVFERDKWVDVSDARMIATAKKNRFYEVEGEDTNAKSRKAEARKSDAEAKAEEHANAKAELSARAVRK